jgi:hypothetical protein
VREGESKALASTMIIQNLKSKIALSTKLMAACQSLVEEPSWKLLELLQMPQAIIKVPAILSTSPTD